jgi:hypothetical protein
MHYTRHRALLLFILLVSYFCSFTGAMGASQEIRPGSELLGTILASKEDRKQALSHGDVIFVGIEKTLHIKKGDMLEIFQETPLPQAEKGPLWFARAGQVIILEIINERLILCVIESSTKEIAVGDKIYFPDH